MCIKFTSEDHKYVSIDGENIDWISVTKLVHFFKQPFDTKKMAELSARGKNPKYAGKTPDEIIKIWENENKRAVNLGSFFHDERERQLLSHNTLGKSGKNIQIISPIVKDGVKYAPEQLIGEGIYPEHLVYLKSIGVCGQSDRIEVVNDYVTVADYKTNKEIKTKGYVGKDGKTKKMLPPLSHLDECNYNDYALQLSIYMYIILKHNYKLKPHKLVIEHIIFDKEGDDENGYPIIKYDKSGQPIVKEVVPYELPYMKKEVVAMFKWLQINRHKLLKNEH
jgi:hypothetical protein